MIEKINNSVWAILVFGGVVHYTTIDSYDRKWNDYWCNYWKDHYNPPNQKLSNYLLP